MDIMDTQKDDNNKTSEKDSSSRRSGKNIAVLIGFPLLFVIIFTILYIYRKEFMDIFRNWENMRDWVLSKGKAAPFVFIGLQILQVIIFLLPGEVTQFAGGFIFGLGRGVLYSIIGIVIGGGINFLLARWLGVPFVKLLFKEKDIHSMERIASSPRAQIWVFIIFLIPGIPKDMVTYIVGLTPMPFFSYLLVSTLGRLPGIIGSTIMGDATAEKNWPLTIVIFAVALILFFLGYFFKNKIIAFLDHHSNHKK